MAYRISQRLCIFSLVLYLFLSVAVEEKLNKELNRGSSIQIGPASVAKSGIVLTIEGWFGNKHERCPWHRLDARLVNGDLLISDSSNSKAKISMPLNDTDNAFILYSMIKNQS
jgi:hypothetical protein